MLVNILTILCTPLITLIGIWVKELFETKRKGMDVKAVQEQDVCSRLDARITDLSNKVDILSDAVSDMKAAHQQTVTLIQVLSDRVEKHNNVIERTYELEKSVAVICTSLENLEKHEKF